MIRSRAETDALTTKPTIAKRAAATNPIPSAPMIPRATGSVASVRWRPASVSTSRLRKGGPLRAPATASTEPSATDSHHSSGGSTVPPSSKRMSDSVARSMTASGSAGIRRRERADAGRDPDLPSDAADRQADHVTDLARRRLEERVGGHDRGRRTGQFGDRGGRESQLGPAAEPVLSQQRRDAPADRPP